MNSWLDGYLPWKEGGGSAAFFFFMGTKASGGKGAGGLLSISIGGLWAFFPGGGLSIFDDPSNLFGLVAAVLKGEEITRDADREGTAGGGLCEQGVRGLLGGMGGGGEGESQGGCSSEEV